MARRIHIMGASGTGTSTLARSLASAISSQAFDTDDFFWIPSDPPFRDRRPVPDRLALMDQMFLPRRDWILSGSVMGWGERVVPRFTHVFFLTMRPAQRLARLRRRERMRYGDEIGPGGTMEAAYRGFLEWAMGYDDPGFQGRSLSKHNAWLAQLSCPVIRLDSSQYPPDLLAEALAALDADAASA